MPAKIVTVFNQKGGCAKTMSTMQLAGAYGLRGLKVFVIDMDPQNTAALWYHQATLEGRDYLKPAAAEKIAPNPAKARPPYWVKKLTKADCGVPVVRVIAPGLRHWWARLGPGRLYDVPPKIGWIPKKLREEELNPEPYLL